DGRIQTGPRQIQPGGELFVRQDLRFQSGENTQSLGIPLETTAVHGEWGQCVLTVAPERWTADVTGQPRGVHQIGVSPELHGDPTADLGDLQRVGESGTRYPADLRPLARTDHLGLTREPAQRRGMQHTSSIPGERPT